MYILSLIAFSRYIFIGTFLLIVSGVSGVTIAHAEGNTPASQEPVKQEPVKPANEYPQEVVRTFMKGCGFTNSKEFCTCSLDKLRSQYTFAEFLKIDTAARETKQVPKEVVDIFQSCRSKVS
ncbi:hypothetical protein FEV09_15380 [Pseudanabaena catenata USMAC16]|uniref:Uncharacterized protein n=2 Tax=Pseudanabaena TaxID=1152 RepID=L8N0P2_9CYAN|nr:hypothetical protein [Pseudanabaena catenata]ELS31823.1 hypothetical protein Pse7429DRAFT_3110 [Pseudanabaena biceps PCC 7429]MDG3495929.1 hypothetical protein [Pseudanabaena catenata USMAC16]